MMTFLLILHVIVCFTLVLIVLLQTGKGAEMGASFGGGSSQTLFGSRGAGTFLTKVTSVAAVIFMLTSLFLAIMSSGGAGPSIVNEGPARQEAPARPGPAMPPGGQPMMPGQAAPGQAPAKPAFPAPQGGR